MRILNSSIIAFIILICVASCKKDSLFGIIGKGKTVTEVRYVNGFTKINLSLDGDLNYVQDSVYYVEVKAQSNILPVLKTQIEGDILNIKFKGVIWKHSPVRIIVHSPEINGFDVNGSGDIYAGDIINTNKLDLSISGSGDISVSSLKGQDLDASISGSGSININGGSLKYEKLVVSGSGSINSINVLCLTTSGKISGSGNITINVVEMLYAKISGSGDIKYRGTPSVDAEISGSGKVQHIN